MAFRASIFMLSAAHCGAKLTAPTVSNRTLTGLSSSVIQLSKHFEQRIMGNHSLNTKHNGIMRSQQFCVQQWRNYRTHRAPLAETLTAKTMVKTKARLSFPRLRWESRLWKLNAARISGKDVPGQLGQLYRRIQRQRAKKLCNNIRNLQVRISSQITEVQAVLATLQEKLRECKQQLRFDRCRQVLTDFKKIFSTDPSDALGNTLLKSMPEWYSIDVDPHIELFHDQDTQEERNFKISYSLDRLAQMDNATKQMFADEYNADLLPEVIKYMRAQDLSYNPTNISAKVKQVVEEWWS